MSTFEKSWLAFAGLFAASVLALIFRSHLVSEELYRECLQSNIELRTLATNRGDTRLQDLYCRY